MFAGFNRRRVLIAGLLWLATILGMAAAPETLAEAPDRPQVRTWTDRSGEHQMEASLVESKDGKVTLKKKDGTTLTVPLKSLSDADREYVKRHAPEANRASEPAEEPRPAGRSKQRAASSQHGRSGDVAEVDLPGGEKSAGTVSPQAREVIVTGVGTDPDKAVQNAFSQAIEQTVGVLVDAETVVKNDELIRDEILTYSRGYVEKYEVVKRWREGGLHHATIRAVVARDKLVEKLRGMKIATKALSGDLAARQIDFDAKNEEQAAEMLTKALANFDMTKLTKVEIVGKPEITREGVEAKVHVKVKLSSDRQQWEEFARGVRLILDKTATRRAAVTVERGTKGRWSIVLKAGRKGTKGTKGTKSTKGTNDAAHQLERQLAGQGVLVALFAGTNTSGTQVQWEVFRVPEPMDEAIRAISSSLHYRTLSPASGNKRLCAVKAISSGLHYRLAYVLSDDKGETIVRTHEPVALDRDELTVLNKHSEEPLEDVWWIGPVWQRSGHFVPVLETETTLSLSQEDLARVAKTLVFLEKEKTPGRSSKSSHRSSSSRGISGKDKKSHNREE